MARKISVKGIRIKPYIHFETTRDGQRGKPWTFQFRFEVGEGSPADPLFYTNKRLQEVITKHSLSGRKLGRSGYCVADWSKGPDASKRVYLSGFFFPFDKFHLSKAEFKDVIGSGHGTNLERKMKLYLRRLMKEHFNPKAKVILTREESTGYRKRQLKRSGRGIEIRKRNVPLEMSLSNINRARAKWHREFKPARPELAKPATALEKSLRRHLEKTARAPRRRPI